MRAKEFFRKNHKELYTLMVFFLLSVIVRTLIGGFAKHIAVLDDEIIYYAMAENLAKQHMFSVFHGKYIYHGSRVIYSILISPAFLTANRKLQFVLIAMINSLILTSGIFPTYLLAKDILKNNNWALFTAFLYILMPDMSYNMTFMADIPILPLGLWLIYLIYLIMDEDERRLNIKAGYVVLFLLITVLTFYTKISALSFPLILIIMIMLQSARFLLKKNGFDLSTGFALITSLSAIFLILTVLDQKIGIWSNFSYWTTWFAELMTGDTREWFYYLCFYYMIQTILALGVLPALLPYVYVGRFGKKEKRLLLLMTITWVAFAIPSCVTSSGGAQEQVFLRYIPFMWMPYLILFLKIIIERPETGLKERIGWGIVAVVLAAIIKVYHGYVQGSSTDFTLLYWVKGWKDHPMRYAAALILVFFISFILIQKEKSAIYAVLMLVLWIGLQGYNNKAAWDAFVYDYKMTDTDYADVSQVEDFIREHSKDTFVLLNHGDGRYYLDATQRELSSVCATTYLNYPNVKNTSLAKVIETEASTPDTGYSLSAHPLTVYLGYSQEDTYFSEVTDADYMIISKASGVRFLDDSAELLDIGDNRLYQIYKLKDTGSLPEMESVCYLRKGHNYYPATADFFSSAYSVDGKPTFESAGGVPGHVIYGPHGVLEPGKYFITLYFEDHTGLAPGTVIGEFNLSSDNYDLSGSNRQILSGEHRVTVQISPDQHISIFETRVYAIADGLNVKGVDILWAR